MDEKQFEALMAQFDRVVERVDKLVDAAPKPESRLMRGIGVIASVAGAAGLLTVFDALIRLVIFLVRGD